MKTMLIAGYILLATAPFAAADNRPKKPVVKVERIKINYQGQEVIARKLTVYSHLPMPLDSAWHRVQTSALLEFVAKGKITFKPIGGKFPPVWRQGDTARTRMKIYGFVPFGGVHTLYIDRVDEQQKIIETKEWDRSAKVWNHAIRLRKVSADTTYYEDEIIIYGGKLTRFITAFAKRFYVHRQKRWQIVAAQTANPVSASVR